MIKKLTYRERRAIYKLYHNLGRSVAVLARQYDVDNATISRVINKKVMMTKKDRKPYTRKIPPMPEYENENITEMLEAHALTLLAELEMKKTALPERARILDVVARIQRQLHEQQIEKYIKRPDAELIARIIRKFKPDATDDEIVVVFNKVLEEWKEDQKK